MARLDNGALLHSVLLEQALEKGTQHTVITDTVTKLCLSSLCKNNIFTYIFFKVPTENN